MVSQGITRCIRCYAIQQSDAERCNACGFRLGADLRLRVRAVLAGFGLAFVAGVAVGALTGLVFF